MTLLRRLGGVDSDADEENLRVIARQCGFLPQALAIVAAHMNHHPDWTTRDHIDALEHLVLTSELSPALALSYDSLDHRRQRVLRLLGISPCPDTTAPACAALPGISVEQAELALHDLRDGHLLQSKSRDRFELHDLVSAYATLRAQGEEPASKQREALRRLFEHYLTVAQSAVAVLFPFENDEAEGASFSSKADAAGWLGQELTNMIALAETVAGDETTGLVCSLARTLRRWLESTARHTVGERLHSLAIDDAGADVGERANAINTLAGVYFRQGRYRLAGERFEEAEALYTELGDLKRLGAVLGNLGNVRQRLGDAEGALADYLRSLELRRVTADHVGEGHTLTNIGFLHQRLGRHDLAIEYFHQGMAIFREAEDTLDLTIALGNLAVSHRELGDLDEAEARHNEALELTRANEDRIGEADTLKDLGTLRRVQGDPEAAVSLQETAVAIAHDSDDRVVETEALIELGRTLITLARWEQAHTILQRAADTSEEFEDPTLTTTALNAAADCLDNLGRDSAPLRARAQALSEDTSTS